MREEMRRTIPRRATESSQRRLIWGQGAQPRRACAARKLGSAERALVGCRVRATRALDQPRTWICVQRGILGRSAAKAVALTWR